MAKPFLRVFAVFAVFATLTGHFRLPAAEIEKHPGNISVLLHGDNIFDPGIFSCLATGSREIAVLLAKKIAGATFSGISLRKVGPPKGVMSRPKSTI